MTNLNARVPIRHSSFELRHSFELGYFELRASPRVLFVVTKKNHPHGHPTAIGSCDNAFAQFDRQEPAFVIVVVPAGPVGCLFGLWN